MPDGMYANYVFITDPSKGTAWTQFAPDDVIAANDVIMISATPAGSEGTASMTLVIPLRYGQRALRFLNRTAVSVQINVQGLSGASNGVTIGKVTDLTASHKLVILNADGNGIAFSTLGGTVL